MSAIIHVDGTAMVQRLRGATVVIMLTACATPMIEEDLRELRIGREERLFEDLAKADYLEPRTAYPLPFGWREPMGCAGSLGMAPTGKRCAHAAARRDARRRRRTRWLAEMRAA